MSPFRSLSKPSLSLKHMAASTILESLILIGNLMNSYLAGNFDITLTSRMTTRAIESFVAEMYLGEGAGGIKCIAARGSGTGRFGRGMGGVDTSAAGAIGASWAFDSAKKVNTLDTSR